MLNDKFYIRRYIITGIVITIVAVYICRLFYLQVIDKSTVNRAESIALLRQTVYPSRGLIYDRNGQLLVFNQPIYDVTMIMREQKDGFDTLSFCEAMNITYDDFIARVRDIKDRNKNRGYSYYTPQVFMSQLSKEDIAVLQESLWKFKGIGIRKRTLRDYTYKAAAHVLGSVGEVSQSDIDNDTYYQLGDYSGRDGIEKVYENYLRGEKGVEVYMRNSKGLIQGKYHDGELDQEAVAGSDLTLTLDIKLQLIAESLLNGKIGSVVAIEPKTGEVLVLASSPTWDSKMLVGRQRSKYYGLLQKDPTKPLFNRATLAIYPPGSTFKTLQTAVCMQDGGLKENTQYNCSGPRSQPIKCTHNHGSPVDLGNALEQSCNPYFWYAFKNFLERDDYGNDNKTFRNKYELWRNDVMQFGLGQKFYDTDISEQSSGYIPEINFYDKYYGKTGWKAVTIRSLSIGQGEIQVTPLQLCNMACVIANNGWYITPHLNKTDSMLLHIHKTTIDSSYFDVIKNGMERVMLHGTGRWSAVEDIRIGGKTGTAQAGKGKKDHAIFIGMAPVDDPQIVVSVIVENSGFGATWAAPIASLLIEQYLNGEITHKDRYNRIKNSILNADVKEW